MCLQEDQYLVLTGASGFIGSAILHHMNEKAYDNIVVVDHFDKSEKWKNLVGKSFAEILDRDQLMPWLKGREKEVGAFIHLGACSSTVETDSRFLLENNYRYSVKLADYALKYDIPFIYASSAATYGDGTLGFSDDHDLLQNLRPLNMYGYSKHLFDLWLQKEGVLDQVVGLKYFNVFGPNEYHKNRMASFVYHGFKSLLQDKSLRLFRSSEPEKYADGQQCRDFIYVKDVARMTCEFLKSPSGGIYNLGRGEPTTWKALAEALIEAMPQSDLSIEYIDMPEDLKGKYQNYTCAKMEKAFSHGISPASFSTKKAVFDYVQNYLL